MTQPLEGQQFSDFHKQAGILDKVKRYVSNLPDPTPVSAAKAPSPVPASTAAAIKKSSQVNWDEVRQRIAEAMPRFHAPEVALGGLVGAAGGGLAGYLNGDMSRRNRKRRWWRYPLVGALAGAGVANLAGDRARRWLSNISDPFSYGLQRKWDLIRKGGLHGFIQGAIMDKPLPLAYNDDNRTDNRMMRREMLRRGLNVHTPNPTTDYFKTVGSTPGGGQLLHLSDRLFTPEGMVKDRDMFRLLAPGMQQLPLDSFQFPPNRPSLQSSALFGNFTATPLGNVTNLYDKWDFDLHDDEKKRTGDLIGKAWKSGWKGLSEPSPGFSTEREELGSLLTRHALDQTLLGRMPAFNQSFYSVPDANDFRPPTYRLPHD